MCVCINIYTYILYIYIHAYIPQCDTHHNRLAQAVHWQFVCREFGCMDAYIYIHAYIHKYICIHALRSKRTPHTCFEYGTSYIRIFMTARARIHTHVYTYIHTYINTYTHTYMCTYTYTYTYMYLYVHTYTHLFVHYLQTSPRILSHVSPPFVCLELRLFHHARRMQNFLSSPHFHHHHHRSPGPAAVLHDMCVLLMCLFFFVTHSLWFSTCGHLTMRLFHANIGAFVDFFLKYFYFVIFIFCVVVMYKCTCVCSQRSRLRWVSYVFQSLWWQSWQLSFSLEAFSTWLQLWIHYAS
jgi:hypothetical protein